MPGSWTWLISVRHDVVGDVEFMTSAPVGPQSHRSAGRGRRKGWSKVAMPSSHACSISVPRSDQVARPVAVSSRDGTGTPVAAKMVSRSTRPSEAAPSASGPAMRVTAAAASPGSRTEAIDSPTEPPLAPEESNALRHTGLRVPGRGRRRGEPVDGRRGPVRRADAAALGGVQQQRPDLEAGRPAGSGSAHHARAVARSLRTRVELGAVVQGERRVGPAYGTDPVHVSPPTGRGEEASRARPGVVTGTNGIRSSRRPRGRLRAGTGSPARRRPR